MGAARPGTERTTTDDDAWERPRRAERPARWLRHTAQTLTANPRFGMAVRAAAAASVSWGLVTALPGFAADYPYYAPLGAVIATSTTVAGSMRQSWQTVAAIALGAGLALAIEQLLGRNLGTVAAVVGIGVLLGGWKRLGSGAGWLPTSALFVLLLGDQHRLSYVAGFAGLTLAGALVGLALVTAFPPLPLAPAKAALDRLRGILADQLGDLGAGLQREGTPLPDDVRARVHTIDPVVAQARDAVHRVEEARRGDRIASRFRPRLCRGWPSWSRASRSCSRRQRSPTGTTARSGRPCACPWRPRWTAWPASCAHCTGRRPIRPPSTGHGTRCGLSSRRYVAHRPRRRTTTSS